MVQACVALLIACGVMWYLLRSRRSVSNKSSRPVQRYRQDTQTIHLYAEVDREQALVEPYPFVFVQKDGTARELHQSEREYLQTPFYPADGGRPYVKSTYEQQNGWGNSEGFLERVKVPPQIEIQPAPRANPSRPLTKEAIKQLMLERGFVVSESLSGSLHLTKPGQDSETLN